MARPERQLWVDVTRSPAGIRTPGFAGHAYTRARELWERLGSPSEFLQVPHGQSRYHAFRGELDLALSLDEDVLRLSRQRNDIVGLVLGHLSVQAGNMPTVEVRGAAPIEVIDLDLADCGVSAEEAKHKDTQHLRSPVTHCHQGVTT